MLKETPFEEMKRYVRFGADDARLLAALRPHAAPHFTRIAAEFYERVREHVEANEVFRDEAQVERLKVSLVRWLGRLCSGVYDQAYCEETAKIGRVHVKVGLPQRYMFTAMTLIQIALEDIATATMGQEVLATCLAVNRVLGIELAIMLEAYRDDFVARIQRTERDERARVDLALSRVQHRYVNAVELARVLVVGIDRAGAICLFNREAERVTGLARDEVAGAPFVETLIAEDARDEMTRRLRAAVGGPSSDEPVPSILRTRAGKLRDVTFRLASVEGPVDDEGILFAIGEDVTDQNTALARMRQAEKLAAVGTLAAGLAHEIRNPLNGAKLHITFLERGLKRAGLADPDAVEAVGVVGDEIDRLSRLVTEFLDFARPTALLKRPGSVNALCARAIQLAAPNAEATHVRLQTDLPLADIALEVDGPKIEQVLLNLIQNGVEAAGANGGGTVIVRARRQPRTVAIEVEDDGPGLPGAEAPIFDAFFSTKPKGTGLGLSIALRIAIDHDGSLDVKSQPGHTVFRVTLPLPP